MARRRKFDPTKHPRDREGQFKRKAGSAGGGLSDDGLYAKPKPKNKIPASRRAKVETVKLDRAKQRRDFARTVGGFVAGSAAGAIAGAKISNNNPNVILVSTFAGAFAGTNIADVRNHKDRKGVKVVGTAYYDTRDLERARRNARKAGY